MKLKSKKLKLNKQFLFISRNFPTLVKIKTSTDVRTDTDKLGIITTHYLETLPMRNDMMYV